MPLSVTFGSKADESPDHHARSRAGMRTFEEALRSLTENNEFQGFDIDVGREIANEFKYMEMLITAALIYWAMSAAFEVVQARIEKRFGKGVDRKSPRLKSSH